MMRPGKHFVGFVKASGWRMASGNGELGQGQFSKPKEPAEFQLHAGADFSSP